MRVKTMSVLVGTAVSAAFLCLCVLMLSRGLCAKNKLCSEMEGMIHKLEGEKIAALEKGEDLRLQIQSTSDADWIELVLKKRLGVVPEGQMKVYFKKDE